MKDNIAIIVLNWNNSKDTIACLESLKKQTYRDFDIILLDNGSTDNSVSEIREWIIDPLNKFKFSEYTKDGIEKNRITIPRNNSDFNRISLVLNNENLGFAAGNNVGIKLAMDSKIYTHVYLLNNDTVLESESIELLMSSIEKNPEIEVATPKITYFDDPNYIWNCGGNINRIGIRKYNYAKESVERCPENNFKITFVTGCALLISTKIILKYGMLTEMFFFGEEDWEFSMRMKENNINIYCIPTSVVMHKVSSSSNSYFKKNNISKACINYVNRFVHFKSRYTSFKWHIWRSIYLIYIFFLLKRKKVTTRRVLKAVSIIKKYSDHCNEVTRETVQKIQMEVEN